jgi:hypothetical protein
MQYFNDFGDEKEWGASGLFIPLRIIGSYMKENKKDDDGYCILYEGFMSGREENTYSSPSSGLFIINEFSGFGSKGSNNEPPSVLGFYMCSLEDASSKDIQFREQLEYTARETIKCMLTQLMSKNMTDVPVENEEGSCLLPKNIIEEEIGNIDMQQPELAIINYYLGCSDNFVALRRG